MHMKGKHEGVGIMKRVGVWVGGVALIGASISWGAPPPLNAPPSTKASLGVTPSPAAEEPWTITVGPAVEFFTYEHDAIQQRSDSKFDNANQDAWREGHTSGDGWGLRLTATRGKDQGIANLTFLTSKSTYDLDVPAGSPNYGANNTAGGSQHIDTERRDFDVSWYQPSGSEERGDWGWTMGIRYLGTIKDFDVEEGDAKLEQNGQVNWYLLRAGYAGTYWPFGRDVVFDVHGGLDALFGQVEGISRTGGDSGYDGQIDESYSTKASLAYGATGLLGVDVKPFRQRDIRLSLDYRRDWLYSFDSTDTGIIVFPDNTDALFIENTYSVRASLCFAF